MNKIHTLKLKIQCITNYSKFSVLTMYGKVKVKVKVSLSDFLKFLSKGYCVQVGRLATITIAIPFFFQKKTFCVCPYKNIIIYTMYLVAAGKTLHFGTQWNVKCFVNTEIYFATVLVSQCYISIVWIDFPSILKKLIH